MYTWFRFGYGSFCRFCGTPGDYYPVPDDEDNDVSYYVIDDYGSLVPVYNH